MHGQAFLPCTTLLKTKSNRRKIVAVKEVIFCDLCFERRIRRYAYAYTEEDIKRPGINRDGRFELSDASVGYSEAPKRARSDTTHEHAHTHTQVEAPTDIQTHTLARPTTTCWARFSGA